MPVRFISEPLCCIISCGPEAGADSTVLAVVAQPCFIRPRPAKLTRQAEHVLGELVAGRPCPQGKKHVAERLRDKGLARPLGLDRRGYRLWEATDAGRRHQLATPSE